MNKKKENKFTHPWWSNFGFSKELSIDEWKEPIRAIQSIKELTLWMKVFLGSASFMMISAGITFWRFMFV